MMKNQSATSFQPDALRVSQDDACAALNKQLTDDPKIDMSTLCVSFRNGRMTIAGTVADRAELHRIEAAVYAVEERVSINNLTTISKRRKAQDAEAARRIQDDLRKTFPDERVAVTVFGDVAVLEGATGCPPSAITGHIHRWHPIHRVIDRLSQQD